jgi:hypothetical protein
MANLAIKHRERIAKVIQEQTFNHQQRAANKAYTALNSDCRAVVIAAEMQSGKSGVALALACLQRQNLSDQAICDRLQLKDTLYLVTMADIALQNQAKDDLSDCPNVIISNFTNFHKTLKKDFKHQAPKLIIVDECHYGSHTDAVRYSQIFNYLEKENTSCKVAFISATPFGALYAAGSDSILRHHFHTQLVFHKTSDEYHGIRQMHHHHQIVKLDKEQRNFCDDSFMRRRFINQFQEHIGAGWSLIRVPNNSASKTKQLLIENGFTEAQIYILGQKLADVPEEDLTSLDDFKREFETAQLFDEKIIAITVAGFRAGINFGQVMKDNLISTWDSTIANVAAVVQANIGRACGYHNNIHAKHYTNLDAIGAYSELLDYLEQCEGNTDFSGLKQLYEKICHKYDIGGFDRGTQITPEKQSVVTKKLDDSKTYLTDSVICVPAKLNEPEFDFSHFTEDPILLEAIKHIRHEYLKDDGPFIKQARALRGEHQNWIKAQWVNGATFDDYSNSNSSAKFRILGLIEQVTQEQDVEFNQVVNPGGGEITDDKKVMAAIFSIYNLSKSQEIMKRAMDEYEVHEMCQETEVEQDNTLIVLFKRGDFSQNLTSEKQQVNFSIESSRIKNTTIFSS